ncbi:putative angiotensin-converting enzyme 2 [Medicago truncatula]|nr:hypothetical protein MTR_7g090290 [Medicago truncatula]RHN47764.1 putative angiotensin-converting enzyme 2 [Medicago truncatula]
MQSYMSPKEVANSLLNEAKIEPKFTELVWQRLEEQNPEFFQAYYTRLALKKQIEEFNKLMHKQKELIDSEQAKVASLPTSNGFHYHDVSSLPTSNGTPTPATTENPACYYVSVQPAEGLNPKNMQHGWESNLSYELNNGGSSFGMVDVSAQGDCSTMHYSQNTNMGFQQGINEGIAISEPEYPSSSTRMFGIDENVLEACPIVGNTSATPIFNNGTGSPFRMVDMSAHGDFSSMHYSQNSNMGFQQGINGGMAITEPEYPSSSPSMFGVDENVMETCPIVRNASAMPIYSNGGSSFHMVEMSAHGDILSMHHSQNSNMDLQQGVNGQMAIVQPEYSSFPHMSGADRNAVETGSNVRDASAMPISGIESNSDSDNEAVMDFLNTCSSFPDLVSLFSGEPDDDPFGLYNIPETPDMLTSKVNS